jgi:hypothetical protein
MSEKQLDRAQVLSPAVDQSRLRPPKRVRSLGLVQSDLSHPGIYDPRVLPG